LVVRIGERPTAADRHETTVALLREDHTQDRRTWITNTSSSGA
jgi:hypothetical protein